MDDEDLPQLALAKARAATKATAMKRRMSAS
jgi:hypothetical protein